MSKYKVDPNDPLPRYYQVYASLNERIQSGQFQAGQALPSERKLVNEYGVSRITIVKALDLLEHDGLISRQHGKGNFVIDQSDAQECDETCKVTFCLPAYADSYLTAILIGATRVAMQHGVQLQIVGADKDSDEVKFIRNAMETEAQGILVFPRFRYRNHDLYQELWERQYPFVMLDRYYPDIQGDYVTFDDEAAGYALTDLLIKQGHQRIAIFIGHEVTVTSVRNRLRGYQRALEANGLPYDEALICIEVYEGLSPASLRHLQSTYLRLYDYIKTVTPTALIAVNNPVAEQMSIDLMKIKTQLLQAAIAGEAVAQSPSLHIAVAAISHKYITYDQNLLVALALQNGEKLGEQAMEILIRRIKKELSTEPQALRLPMEIVALDKATATYKELS